MAFVGPRMSMQPNLNRSRLADFGGCGVYGSLASGGIGGYLFRLSWNLANSSKHCMGDPAMPGDRGLRGALGIAVQISEAQCELRFIGKGHKFARN